MKLRNAVVVDGVRTAFTKGGRGKLEAARMDDLGAELIKAIFERNPKVKMAMIDEFGVGGNLGSGTAHLAGLPPDMTDFSSARACATSQETAMRISMAIMLGAYDCGISLGTERMGRGMGGGGGGRTFTRRDGPNPKAREVTKFQRDMLPSYSRGRS